MKKGEGIQISKSKEVSRYVACSQSNPRRKSCLVIVVNVYPLLCVVRFQVLGDS